MRLPDYIVMFVLVWTMGVGVPGAGDASLLAAGTLAGEGRLNVWAVVVVAMAAWMLGSATGYAIGARQGRWLLERPGWLERSRRNLLAKGDRLFGQRPFLASVTMPGFVSGIFHLRFALFMLGALAAGSFWIGVYVVVSYFLGAKIAQAIGDAGTGLVLGVVAVVALGLACRAVLARWRSARPVRAASPHA
jgi:membrane protein DedA with SNARE-associated domain